MRLQRQSNKQIIDLTLSSVLGHGGEARVYVVPQDESLVAKVYHQPGNAHTHKLLAMLANPPENPTAGQGHISIAWPIDLLRTAEESQRVVGFLMPRVKGMRSILDFYNPKTRRQHCPLFNYLYLHRTARNLAAAVGALHARGYCIGDVNESNILVSNTALVTLVDTDSFQVREPETGLIYRCGVGKPEFTPPELQGQSFAKIDRVPEHDLFGLAVLIFQLLMEGTHPFAGIFQGTGDPPPYEARIASGHFSHSHRRRVPYLSTPIAPPFETLHPTLRQLFVRCFDDGHSNPKMRPSAQTWQDAITEAENALVSCSHNSQHRYGNHLHACPWCDRTAKLGGRDPFPSQQAVQQGRHLPPVKQKQSVPGLGAGLKPVSTRAIPTLKPLRATVLTKHQQKFGLLLISCVSLTVLVTLELLVSIKNLNFGPTTSVTRAPLANDSTSPNPQSSSNKGSLAYYNQGYSYYKLGDYEGAIEKFSQALRLNPNDTGAYINRGTAYYEIGQKSGDPDKAYQVALQDFNQALRLDPKSAEAYIKRGIVRSEIAQYGKDPDKDYKLAIQDFNQALSLNSQADEAYLNRGTARYKLAQYSGDASQGYTAAIQDFNQALRLNPQEAEAYVKRGLVRYEVAQYSRDSDKYSKAAIEDLQKAAKIFLDRGDIDSYQQALNSICTVLDQSCDSLLQNSEDLLVPSSQPIQGKPTEPQ